MGKQQRKKDKANLLNRPVGGMAIASGWPVHEVLLSQGWNKEAALITILIARRSPNSGKVASTLLLVDLACLGVKSAQVKLFKEVTEYNAGLRAHALRLQTMEPTSLDLAAKIVRGGLAYAGALGFKPDNVYVSSKVVSAHIMALCRIHS
ncbi:MAG: hypothetical protein HC822_15275 [Oscillochloris sp.]|nr:hypothetical protein [Oscillochloris sp.]